MDKTIFVVPKTHEPLFFEGDIVEQKGKNGKLVTKDGTISFPVLEGIPSFINPDDDVWSDDEQRQANFVKEGITEPENIIPSNYEMMSQVFTMHPKYKPFIEQIGTIDGRIMDIASGPSGGLSVGILNANPKAELCMTDMGLWPLRQW